MCFVLLSCMVILLSLKCKAGEGAARTKQERTCTSDYVEGKIKAWERTCSPYTKASYSAADVRPRPIHGRWIVYESWRDQNFLWSRKCSRLINDTTRIVVHWVAVWWVYTGPRYTSLSALKLESRGCTDHFSNISPPLIVNLTITQKIYQHQKIYRRA